MCKQWGNFYKEWDGKLEGRRTNYLVHAFNTLPYTNIKTKPMSSLTYGPVLGPQTTNMSGVPQPLHVGLVNNPIYFFQFRL